MKKFIIVLLVLILTTSLYSCKNEEKKEPVGLDAPVRPSEDMLEEVTVFGKVSSEEVDSIKIVDGDIEYNIVLSFELSFVPDRNKTYKVRGGLDRATNTIYVDDYYDFLATDAFEHTDHFEYEFEYKTSSSSHDDILALTPEEQAKEFLSALCLKNKEVLELYFAGNSHDEFLKADINVSISDIRTVDIPGRDIEVQFIMNVENSETELFANGVSDYTLILGDSGLGNVLYFGKSENKDYSYQGYWGTEYGEEIPEELRAPHDFAERYMSYISKDENVAEMSLGELLGEREGQRLFDRVFHAMIHYFPKGMDVKGEFNYYATTADIFVESVEYTFGFGDDILYKFRQAFNNKYPADENGVSYVDCSHGNNYIPKALTDFKEENGKITLIYELFADSIYALKASEVTFTFEKTKEGLKFISIENKKINDYEIFGYAF